VRNNPLYHTASSFPDSSTSASTSVVATNSTKLADRVAVSHWCTLFTSSHCIWQEQGWRQQKENCHDEHLFHLGQTIMAAMAAYYAPSLQSDIVLGRPHPKFPDASLVVAEVTFCARLHVHAFCFSLEFAHNTSKMLVGLQSRVYGHVLHLQSLANHSRSFFFGARDFRTMVSHLSYASHDAESVARDTTWEAHTYDLSVRFFQSHSIVERLVHAGITARESAVLDANFVNWNAIVYLLDSAVGRDPLWEFRHCTP
jgi:hypothetical protein